MKPTSIRRFDLLYLASVALSLVAYLLSYDSLLASVEQRTASTGVHLGVGTVIVTMIVSIGLSLLFWFLVSRRMALGKWLIVLFFLFGLTGIPGLISGGWTVLKALSAFNLLLEAAAIFYLFQPDAKAWFAGRDAASAIDGGDADRLAD